MSAVARFDINGNACGSNCNAYITIKIEDEQVFKSETIDQSASADLKQTFVSESISVSANIEIEMWTGEAVLMSSWKETAEVYASRGEQTLSGKNSLTIRAKKVKDGEKSGMSSTCVS